MALLLYLNTHQELKPVSQAFLNYLQGETFLQQAHGDGYATALQELRALLPDRIEDSVLATRLSSLLGQ